MLPPPCQGKNPPAFIKKSEAHVSKDLSRPTHPLHPIRFLSGSIDEILKWSKVTHKHPPLYETIGLYLHFTFPFDLGTLFAKYLQLPI